MVYAWYEWRLVGYGRMSVDIFLSQIWTSIQKEMAIRSNEQTILIAYKTDFRSSTQAFDTVTYVICSQCDLFHMWTTLETNLHTHFLFRRIKQEFAVVFFELLARVYTNFSTHLASLIIFSFLALFIFSTRLHRCFGYFPTCTAFNCVSFPCSPFQQIKNNNISQFKRSESVCNCVCICM